MQSEVQVIHYVVQDDRGPIASGPMPGALSRLKPHRTRLRCACDPKITFGENNNHNGSGVPYVVTCEKCKATDRFKRDYYPHPNQQRVEPPARPALPASRAGEVVVEPAVLAAVAKNPALVAASQGCC